MKIINILLSILFINFIPASLLCADGSAAALKIIAIALPIATK